jgi:hypothetical protein
MGGLARLAVNVRFRPKATGSRRPHGLRLRANRRHSCPGSACSVGNKLAPSESHNGGGE